MVGERSGNTIVRNRVQKRAPSIAAASITSGGPQQATTILVYKVYSDGFVGQDLGSSAAQSVILLFIVSVLTIIQFKFIERRVHY